MPVVLWIFILLSLMYSGYSYSVRTETAMTQQLMQSARTRAAADAGVQMAIERLLSAKQENEMTLSDPVYEDVFNGINLRIAIFNESGRVDLNKASAELLDILLEDAVPESQERMTIIDSLLDWRDADNETRDFGAEDDDYSAMGKSYGAADAALSSVDELLRINGMTVELFNSLKAMFTVYSGAAVFNPGLSPKMLLRSLSGHDDYSVEAVLQNWHLSTLEETAALLGNIPANLISKKIGNIYNIEVEASLESGAKTRLSTIIKLVDNLARPYNLLSWREVEQLDFIQ